jgi:uncharacterized membrane protein HdeD (DUF308 family)
MNDLASLGLVNALASRWWLILIRGLAAITFGILALIWPGHSLMALVVLFGIYALVDGFFDILLAMRRGRAGESWGWLLFEGLVGIAAGVLTLVWPAITAIVLFSVIAIWAVVTGIAEIATAIRLRKQIRGEWFLVLAGLASIACGILLLRSPAVGVLVLAYTIGIYALVFGVLLCALAFRMNRWRRSSQREVPIGGAPSPV